MLDGVIVGLTTLACLVMIAALLLTVTQKLLF